MEKKEIEEAAARARAFFQTKKTLDVKVRIRMLQRLKASLTAHEEEIGRALQADLGKSRTESYMCEIGMTQEELTWQIRHLKSLARTRRRPTSLANFPAKSFVMQEPYGCVLILSPWNYPLMLCLEPLAGAVAAGNVCVLKPSAYSPATSSVIAKIIREVFPPGYVTVVEGGRRENAALLDQKFDYIFFTGSVHVGKWVMEKAAAHLTPVTLELGGKSPCIVAKNCDLKLAARRIVFGKFLNCGQTCVAPDYILIDRKVKDDFLPLLASEIARQYGADPLRNPDYGRIISRRHFDRLLGLIDPDRVVLGGDSREETLQIAPTVLDGVTGEDAVMQEEIFGPILPILTYDTPEEAETFITSREKPLALYLFTDDRALQKRFLSGISFGGGCVNDTIMHLTSSEMGFGGVGASGMGSYHGKKSFETFSHEKSILQKSCRVDLPMRYQPYKKSHEKVIRLFLR